MSGTPQQPTIELLVDEVRHGATDADRIRAAEALGRAGTEESLLALANSVREPYSSDVSAAVVRGLAAIGPRGETLLSQLLHESDNAAVRAHLKWAIAAVKPPPPPRLGRLASVNLGRYALALDCLIVLAVATFAAYLALYFYATTRLEALTNVSSLAVGSWLILAVATEVVALTLAGLLRRWGWFVGCLLLPVLVAPFAILLRLDVHRLRRVRVLQAPLQTAKT